MDRSFNRIELRGNAGQDARIMKVGDNTVARFNIATNETYKDRSGNLKEETTWLSVTAWGGKYTTASGEEKAFYEVLASRVNIEETQMA